MKTKLIYQMLKTVSIAVENEQTEGTVVYQSSFNSPKRESWPLHKTSHHLWEAQSWPALWQRWQSAL